MIGRFDWVMSVLCKHAFNPSQPSMLLLILGLAALPCQAATSARNSFKGCALDVVDEHVTGCVYSNL
jgi:hypothetical protein